MGNVTDSKRIVAPGYEKMLDFCWIINYYIESRAEGFFAEVANGQQMLLMELCLGTYQSSKLQFQHNRAPFW